MRHNVSSFLTVHQQIRGRFTAIQMLKMKKITINNEKYKKKLSKTTEQKF